MSAIRSSFNMSGSGNPTAVSALSAQIQTNALRRTLSGVVRADLPIIEEALRHGLRYEQLCQHLAALGIKVSAATLRQTVYRLRREQRPEGAEVAIRAPALGVASPTSAPPTALDAPAPAVPQRISPTPAARLARLDNIPLIKPAAGGSLTARQSTDYIAEISQSFPDLDQLADRFRRSRTHKDSAIAVAEGAATATPAAPASPSTLHIPATTPPPSPVNTSS